MLKRERELIDLMGWQNWLWYSLRLDAAWAWFERIYYCHQNARDLDDLRYRMSGVLMEATNGRMSKTNYDEATMRTEITNAFEEQYQSGYDDALASAIESRDEI